MVQGMARANPSTLHDPRSPADICRDRGWTVGTRIVGDEGYGPTVLVITAIGEHHILARPETPDTDSTRHREQSWALDCRDWQQI